MNEEKEIFGKITWIYVALGFILLLMGAVMIVQGIEAHNTGAIIPATTKSGSMTGLQSIIIGCFATILGTVFLGYEILKRIKRK
jgi:hypothetical protein